MLQYRDQKLYIQIIVHSSTYAIFIQGDPTTCYNIHWHTMTLHSLKYIEVARLMVCLGRDSSLGVRVPNHKICIRTNCYPALKWTFQNTFKNNIISVFCSCVRKIERLDFTVQFLPFAGKCWIFLQHLYWSLQRTYTDPFCHLPGKWIKNRISWVSKCLCDTNYISCLFENNTNLLAHVSLRNKTKYNTDVIPVKL